MTPVHALRAALKTLLRQFGFRCESIRLDEHGAVILRLKFIPRPARKEQVGR